MALLIVRHSVRFVRMGAPPVWGVSVARPRSPAARSGESPAHQLQVRSWLKVSMNLDWDSNLRCVCGRSRLAIPGYVRLDTRPGRRLPEYLASSIVGQNLKR